jgi:hypothetical protein
MMREPTGGVLAVFAVVLLFLGYLSLFTVPQTRQALVVRLGDPVRTITEPGLHVKIPLIDTVIYVDNRILDLENSSQEVICSDQKRLVVDAFARVCQAVAYVVFAAPPRRRQRVLIGDDVRDNTHGQRRIAKGQKCLPVQPADVTPVDVPAAD